jgi:hypothetical protein
MGSESKFWKEGVTAGLLGAAGVAFWFLIVDLIAGRAFTTPEMLGEALFSVLGKGIDWSPAAYVVAYTLVHIAAFIVVGTFAAWTVAASKRTPGVLAGLLLLFVVFEAGFYFLTLFLSQDSQLGNLAWYQIGAANLLAAFLMGRYLWVENPGVGERLGRVLEGQV